jgi:hypothetical protein
MPKVFPERKGADNQQERCGLSKKAKGRREAKPLRPFPPSLMPPRGRSYGVPLSNALCSIRLSPSIWNGFFSIGRSQ